MTARRASRPARGKFGAGVLRTKRASAGGAGFTLVELCLVLALLAIAAALIAPSLANFIRGRALDAEASRLLSLTHAAQSRAVSEGMPMLLWFNAPQGTYGTEEEARPGAADPKALQFSVNDRLRLTLSETPSAATTTRQRPAIRFLPDGSINEASPARVCLTDSSGRTLWLGQTRNRMGYEIQPANQ